MSELTGAWRRCALRGALVLLCAMLVDGDAAPYPGRHREGFGHFLRTLREGMPMYNAVVQPLDARAALMELVRNATPLDHVWGEPAKRSMGEQDSELRHGVLRTLALTCVVGVLVGAAVGAFGALHWRESLHPDPHAIARCGCGYENDPDYRNDCPGIFLVGLYILLVAGLSMAIMGTISCSHSFEELPRVLVMVEDAAVFTLSYTTNVQNFMRKFMGDNTGVQDPKMGLLGERSNTLAAEFLAGKDEVGRQRDALRAELIALQMHFQDFKVDQNLYFPFTGDEYSVYNNLAKLQSLVRVLDRVPDLEMDFPNSGKRVFAIANTTWYAAYQNMQHLQNITSPQLSDVQRMRSSTLLYSHRAITIALQCFFGMAAFICLIVGANTVLRDDSAWAAAYVLVILSCLSAWCLLGAVFPQAVVLDAICYNMNTTTGHIGSPLLNTVLTRSNKSSPLSSMRLRGLSQRMSTGCLDPTSDNSTARLFHVLALDYELISSVFGLLRLDAQFDTQKVLDVSYNDFSGLAKKDLAEISGIGGLKDFLLPRDDKLPPCSQFSTGVCLQKASECSRFEYAQTSSSFVFNCSRRELDANCLPESCDECERSCKCCDMMLQLQVIQRKAAAIDAALTRLESTLKQLQSDLTFELDLQQNDSFHSLLKNTEIFLHDLDQSCKTPRGMGALYRELRHEMCHNLLIDQDIQWFAVGLLAFLFSPWLPFAILMVRIKFPDKYARTADEVCAPQVDPDVQLYEDVSYQDFMATGGQLLTSPPVTGPAAAQALRNAMPSQSLPVLPKAAASGGTPVLGNLADSPYLQIWEDCDVDAVAFMPEPAEQSGRVISVSLETADIEHKMFSGRQPAAASVPRPAVAAFSPSYVNITEQVKSGQSERNATDARPKQVDLDSTKAAPTVAQRKAALDRKSAKGSLPKRPVRGGQL